MCIVCIYIYSIYVIDIILLFILILFFVIGVKYLIVEIKGMEFSKENKLKVIL